MCNLNQFSQDIKFNAPSCSIPNLIDSLSDVMMVTSVTIATATGRVAIRALCYDNNLGKILKKHYVCYKLTVDL